MAAFGTRARAFLWIGAAVVGGVMVAAVPHLMHHSSSNDDEAVNIEPSIGMAGAPPTSAEGLQQRISGMEQRLRDHPRDVQAAVLLADALLRLARATNDSRPTSRASDVLTGVLKQAPGQYDALRMLGAIDLSQHRFRQALEVARQARDLRPDDAWNYGVMGDALIEIGEYDRAFEAFDMMVSMRPSATAYARVAYARELRGDLNGAVTAMLMAGQSTAVEDLEARAWYAAQVGELYLRLGRVADADREYQRAAFLYPAYPHAMIGKGKVKAARGDRDGALAAYLEQLARTPTLDLASRIGDLYAERDDSANAERYYQLAEDLAGPPITQTEANLALFLAEHDRKLPEAVAIAERVASERRDIFTEDALAWAYFKSGRLSDARRASERALRTGSHDERLRSHAAQIRAAVAGGA